MPLFSVVIVNFNHGRFLAQAIHSVVEQSCQDFELLVVDGGSSDNSVAVIREHAKDLTWWVSEPDRGQSDAFNKGFARATGTWLLWVNADDLLLPGALDAARRHIARHPRCEWLAGDTVFMGENENVMWCAQGPRWIGCLVRHGPVYVYGPTAFFKRDLFRRVGEFDTSLHYTMDTDLWMRFLREGIRFERVRHYCWGFRMHAGSKTSHTFGHLPSDAYAVERQRLESKHQFHENSAAKILQTGWKLLSGCYLRAWFDTWRWRNRSAGDLFSETR